MVADSSQALRVEAGLRPMNPARDLGQVAALMEAAFGSTLDAAGRASLEGMRRMASGGVLGWLNRTFGALGLAFPPGFVWIADGRIVGNISVRPGDTPGGWFVGNVAVHPDYRRRGLARALLDAAISLVETRGGRWIVLQVDADNERAQRLYRALGFHTVGTLVRWRRGFNQGEHGEHGEDKENTPRALRSPRLNASASGNVVVRPRRSGEWRAEYELAQSVLPPALALIEPVLAGEFRPGLDGWLARLQEGVREEHWLATVDGSQVGAARVRRPGLLAGPYAHEARVDLYVHPDWSGTVEAPLLARALAPVTVSVRCDGAAADPAAGKAGAALESALRASGFVPARTLDTLRLALAA
jgi:ribosomal protein S18 acetylase RimI-like enzyme